jgi:catechol 2,3-dioxygenase-like lactoylglutathione lyase family enzyme
MTNNELRVPHLFRSFSRKECAMDWTRCRSIGLTFRSLARLPIALPLASLALFSWFAAALPYDPAPAPPPLAGFAHAAIRVADLDASRAFYLKLGFEQAFAFDKDGVTTQSFIKINDRQFIELYPRAQSTDPVGFLHVCFESEDIVTLHTFYEGHSLTPTAVRKAAAGNLLFTMEGPEHQNIEYTEYMPGSRHSSDAGQHLGENRIANAIVAAGLPMQDAAAAKTFYVDKLAFKTGKPLESAPKNDRTLWLQLPGFSGQSIAFFPSSTDAAFRMVFAVDNLNRTATRLQTLGIPSTKNGKDISIHDPDGNVLVFVVPPPVISSLQ